MNSHPEQLNLFEDPWHKRLPTMDGWVFLCKTKDMGQRFDVYQNKESRLVTFYSGGKMFPSEAIRYHRGNIHRLRPGLKSQLFEKITMKQLGDYDEDFYEEFDDE